MQIEYSPEFAYEDNLDRASSRIHNVIHLSLGIVLEAIDDDSNLNT